ncbi:hypothetical protein GCM10010282_54020 [Streptomyces roseolus]|nr:hypothetical protein GCM10010282_54020 [Streptomyces roseolus]
MAAHRGSTGEGAGGHRAGPGARPPEEPSRAREKGPDPHGASHVEVAFEPRGGSAGPPVSLRPVPGDRPPRPPCMFYAIPHKLPAGSQVARSTAGLPRGRW